MADSKDAKAIGGDLKNSGVSVDRNFEARIGGSTYGLEIGGGVRKNTSIGEIGVSVLGYTGTSTTSPQIAGKADWLPLSKDFNVAGRELKAKAGAFGEVMYGDRGYHPQFAKSGNAGFAPIVGGTFAVEDVKTGVRAGFDVGVPLTGSGYNRFGYNYPKDRDQLLVSLNVTKRF
jgi:hypothetical protein